ncbi:MAG: DUF2318 domain-containing protein [Bacteroidetes bacterium]|nr:MAG: DUF2318 domain-containing protein [Bacteroidota bacterium]
MKISSTKINTLNYISLLLFVVFLMNFNFAKAQDKRHPVSEITQTAKYYSYQYIIDGSTLKNIEYFIVKDGSGNFKTAFNACEVCYKADKGYSQKGDKMHCNNCGNEYPIENLGSQDTGGCWPGYLPHTISGDEIVIQISDIEKGAYLFPPEPYSDVNDPMNLPPSFTLIVKVYELLLTMPTPAERNIRIFDMNAHILSSLTSNANELSINTGNLSCGVYMLVIQEGKYTYYRLFNIGR